MPSTAGEGGSGGGSGGGGGVGGAGFAGAAAGAGDGAGGGGLTSTGALECDDPHDVLRVSMSPNPSHLEAVNPVVLGTCACGSVCRCVRGSVRVRSAYVWTVCMYVWCVNVAASVPGCGCVLCCFVSPGCVVLVCVRVRA
jgi:hypothetical protein